MHSHTCRVCECERANFRSLNPLNYLSSDWGQHSCACDDAFRQNVTKQETRGDGSHRDVVIDHWCTSNQRLGAADG